MADETQGLRSMFAAALAPAAEAPPLQQETPVALDPPQQEAEVVAPPEPEAIPVPADEPVTDEFSLDLDADPLVDAPQGEAETQEPAAPDEDANIEQLKKFARESGTSEARFRTIYEAHKVMRELQKPPEDGGLGFRPEVSQIKVAFEDHRVFDQMKTDFSTGDPNAARPFTGYWFGVDRAGRPHPGSIEIAEELPHQLAQINPQAFEALKAPIVLGLQQHLQKLATTGNYSDDDKARLGNAAAVIAAVANTASQASPATPKQPQQEMDELSRLRRQVAEMQGRQRQESESSVIRTVDSHILKVLEADVERALLPLKQHYAASPNLFNAAKTALQSKVLQEMKTNRTVMTMVENAKVRMSRHGNMEELPAVTRMVRQAYESRLNAHRTTYLKEAGVTMAAKANQQRAQLQQSSQRTAPVSSGVSPGQSAPVSQPKQPHESGTDYRKRVMREAMQAQ